MIAVLLADGFEEVEALTPIDLLRRAGLDVRTVGMNGKIITGSHKIPIICDAEPNEIDVGDVSLVILPGGMPGALGLDASPFTDKILSAVNERGGRIAAICAAPFILGKRGLLKGKRAVCYPGFEKDLIGATVADGEVVTDGNITTSKGMGTAFAFAEELVRLVCGEEKQKELSASVCRSVAEETDGDSEIFKILGDSQFLDAVDITLKAGKISAPVLQKKLGMGYGKAARYLDTMEELGIIGESDGRVPHGVIMSADEWQALLAKHGVTDNAAAEEENDGAERDEFSEAVKLVTESGQASTSLLQRKLGIGYVKAARYLDKMEELDIVGEPVGHKPREVLMTADEWKRNPKI